MKLRKFIRDFILRIFFYEFYLFRDESIKYLKYKHNIKWKSKII